MPTESSQKSRERIEKVTTYYLYRYAEIICQYFPGITIVDQFIQELNHGFSHYDDRIALSLNPEHILETKRLSCVSAALLIGLWNDISGSEGKPSYWLKKVGTEFDENTGLLLGEPDVTKHKKQSHAVIELPSNPSSNHPRFFHGFTPEDGDDQFTVIEYDNSERRIEHRYTPISFGKNLGTIAANEISRVEAHKREEGIPQPHEHPYGQFIGKYNELVVYFRSKYVHSMRADV